MNDQQATRMVGVLVALGLAGLAACSGADPAGAAGPEKVATTADALIQSNPAAPYAFPGPVFNGQQYPLQDCMRTMKYTAGSPGILASVDGENYLALPATSPTDDAGNSDPYWTQYTHGYRFNASNCAANDLSCTLETDFFSIPSAHGFKYNVKKITGITCVGGGGLVPQICTATTTDSNWYVEGLQRVDESWWTRPWRYSACTNSGCAAPVYQQCTGGNCPAPWTILDANSHPPYGTDAKSADWLQLWNLAYTYSYDPSATPSPPNELYTTNIASEHHQCAAIYANASDLQLIDFFVAMEKHDPGGTDW